MEAAPDRRWSVTALARGAGLSRAAFARRFAEEIGQPPLRWLAEHRLALAGQLLVDTNATLAQVAARLDYRSEFALGKAFKRLVGMPPGVFREQARILSGKAGPPAFRAAA